jgi:hypothetical protein
MGRREYEGGRSRTLSRSEEKRFLGAPDTVVDTEFAALGIDARRLGDGRVVTVHIGSKARLWESRDLLLATLSRSAADPGPRSVAASLRSGSQFLDELTTLLSSAPAKLDLPREALDFSIASIERIDEVRRRKDGKRRVEKALDEIVAYVGEVVRRALDGHWEMRVSDDGKTPEPVVVMKDGRVSHPGVFVLREIDLGREGSLLAVTEQEIESFGPHRDIKVPPPDDT